MREILFKAKRKDNGEWVEGYYIYHIKRTICPLGDSVKPEDEQHVIMQDGFSDWNMPRDTVVYEIDPNTLCQYTGLTDKNSKKIWENDIVDTFEESSKEILRNVVKFEDGCFKVFKEHYLPMDFDSYEKTDLKVIGNIFDNPELLEEEP